MQPARRRQIAKYFREYQWSNVAAMIRNSKAEPAKCGQDFPGRNVLITGATAGIGYATAIKYASHGANLLCINRNEEKSQALCTHIRAEYAVECDYITADLSRVDEVRRAGSEVRARKTPLDVIIHNAGIYRTRRETTPDGLEIVFAVNHLSSFVLTFMLMDKLKSENRARILLVNSEGHRFAAWGLRLDDLNWEKRRYSGMRSYGSAKTAQLLSMMKFNDYFESSAVTINAMHPGAVKTQTGRENGPAYNWIKHNIIERNFQSPAISAEALYYLGVSEELEGVSGKFFNLTTAEAPAPPALDREVAEQLWEISVHAGGADEKQQL